MSQSKGAFNDAVRELKTAGLYIAFTSIFINLLMLVGPIYMLQIYDRVLSSKSVSTLVALTVLVAALYLLMCLLDILRSFMLVRTANHFDSTLSGSVYKKSLTHPVKGTSFSPLHSLDIIRRFLSGPGPSALMDIPWTPLFLILIFMMHPTLGLFATSGTIIIVLMVIANDHLARRKSEDIANHKHIRQQKIASIAGKRETSVVMGMVNRLTEIWQSKNQSYLDEQQRALDSNALFRSSIKSFRLFLQSALLGLGAYLVIQQEISTGVMIAASIIVARALAPIEQAVSQWGSLIAALQSYSNLNHFMRSDEVHKPSVTLPLPSTTLSVHNISICPNAHDDPIIKRVSFHLNTGDSLGIIGPSGSGKSTLVRGFLGTLPITSGYVTLDGSEINHWDHERLGDAIGYLPQKVELLEGTIAENICRFAKGPDSNDIIYAAKLAGAHEIIVGLKDGYDTYISDTSSLLSGGQLQRIGLARAFYQEPFLVVLDEPNSNLDKSGETALLKAIEYLKKKGSIIIIVSHRYSGVSNVDKLMIIENGKMTGFGDKSDILPYVTAKKQVNE